MTRSARQLVYRDVGPEGIDAIRELWEKLSAYHAQMSPRFGNEIRSRTFEVRKQSLLAREHAIRIRVELVSVGADKPDIGFCVSTVSADGAGEIASIFVDRDFRGQGIGTELMRRALAWLESMKATSKIVSVMYENNEALAFYQRFGFHPRAVLLQESHKDLG